MSIENHPNFHAVNFVVLTMDALYKSIRGNATIGDAQLVASEMLSKFVCDVESRIDELVKQKYEEKNPNYTQNFNKIMLNDKEPYSVFL